MHSLTSSASVLAVSPASSDTAGTIYFGSGSNLWLDQMARRCPDSEWLGIARLPGYRWIINSRGSANVVQVTSTSQTTQDRLEADDSPESSAWGLVYRLTAADEANLDIREGVPHNHTKEILTTHFWPSKKVLKAPFESAVERKIDVTAPWENIQMLAYTDRLRITKDKPRDEYIIRMSKGIIDALKVGIPEEYVEGVMRRFIPKDVKPSLEALDEAAIYSSLGV